MATNYDRSSLLEAALSDIRLTINDHMIDGRYRDNDLVARLALCYNIALTDLNTAMSKNPIYVTHFIDFNTTDTEYLLPTGVGGIAQFAIPDPTNPARILSIVPSFNLNEVTGPNWSVVLPFLRMQSPFVAACTGRITFQPKAEMLMYRGTAPAARTILAGVSTFVLDGTVDYGQFDKRPNAFIGGMLRVYSADIPAGYAGFPVQERVITKYAADTRTLTLNKGFDVQVSNVGAVPLLYEIVPLIDPGIMAMAALETARFFCNRDNMVDKARSLERDYEREKTAVRRNYDGLNKVKKNEVPHKLRRLGFGGTFRMG